MRGGEESFKQARSREWIGFFAFYSDHNLFQYFYASKREFGDPVVDLKSGRKST